MLGNDSQNVGECIIYRYSQVTESNAFLMSRDRKQVGMRLVLAMWNRRRARLMLSPA